MSNEVKKYTKAQRIMAMVGIVLLISIYLVTIVAALLAKPYANRFFYASLFCTLIIPVLVYGFMVVSKAFGPKEGQMSIREFRKMKEELKKTDGDAEAK